jgi:hypothetical protein
MRQFILASFAAVVIGMGAVADDKPGAGQGKPGAGRGQMLLKLFEKADANGDGKLSLEEFKNALEKAPKGKLKDHPELAEKLFKRIDANGDGFITRDEMQKFLEKRKDRAPGQKKPGPQQDK